MENTLVSARVSRAKKERAVGVLTSLGATTSDLINSAFDYVIAKKELPDASAKGDVGADASAFASFVEASTLDVDWPAGFDGDYKSLAAGLRVYDYESLA